MNNSDMKKLLIIQISPPEIQSISSSYRYNHEMNFAKSISHIQIVEIESIPEEGQLYFTGPRRTGREFYCLQVRDAPAGFDAIVISTSGQKAKS